MSCLATPSKLTEHRATALLPRWVVLLLMCVCCACAFAAQGFRVESVDIELVDDVYQVDAAVDYRLSPTALEALENGVPLVLELNLEVLQRRRYLWDAVVAAVVQRYRISYRPLGQQYQVENLNTEDLEVFPSLSAAMAYLNGLRGFPLLDQALLDPQQHYRLGLRASLDIESLPTPLRAMAYVTPDWYLGSPWYYLDLPQ